MFCIAFLSFAKDFNGHFMDIKKVFPGYCQCEKFKKICKLISNGMDNTLPKAYRDSYIKIPDNHRLVGHMWEFNSDVPKETLQEILNSNPGKTKTEIMKVYSDWKKQLLSDVQKITNLSTKRTKHLVGLIWDIHLLGDLTTTRSDLVLPISEIKKYIVNNIEELFGHSSQYRLNISSLKKIETPDEIINYLRKSNIDRALNECYGKSTTIKYKDMAKETIEYIKSHNNFKNLFIANIDNIRNGIGSKKTIQCKAYPVRRVPLNMGYFVPIVGGECLFFFVDVAKNSISYSNSRISTYEFINAIKKDVLMADACITITLMLDYLGPAGWCVSGVVVAGAVIHQIRENIDAYKYNMTLDDIRKWNKDSVYEDSPFYDTNTRKILFDFPYIYDHPFFSHPTWNTH